MQVSQCSSWAAARVELDRKVGEAIDIYVNTRLVARGECGGRGSLGGP
jgi:flagellar motor switch protein FliN/FliY